MEENKPNRQSINLFESVLVISSRAKDLQQINTIDMSAKEKPTDLALAEYAAGKLAPEIVPKSSLAMARYKSEGAEEEEEEE